MTNKSKYSNIPDLLIKPNIFYIIFEKEITVMISILNIDKVLLW